jgi:zinc protease
MIIATARAGHTLPEIEAVIQEELKALMTTSPPTGREVERAVNGFESSFIAGLERVGGFGGKANQLNSYYFRTGNPDYFNEDLGRYRALDPDDIGAAAAKIIGANGFVSLSIVPEGKRDLAEPKPPATRQ